MNTMLGRFGSAAVSAEVKRTEANARGRNCFIGKSRRCDSGKTRLRSHETGAHGPITIDERFCIRDPSERPATGPDVRYAKISAHIFSQRLQPADHLRVFGSDVIRLTDIIRQIEELRLRRTLLFSRQPVSEREMKFPGTGSH